MATPSLMYKAPNCVTELRLFLARLMQDLANGRITLHEANAQCRLANAILRSLYVQYLHNKKLGITRPTIYLESKK